MASIITNRLILIIAATVITAAGGYYSSWSCGKIDFELGKNKTLNTYPACEAWYNGTSPDQNIAVKADMNGGVIGAGAALDSSFGVSTWLSFMIHAAGVEIYVSFPKSEDIT